MAGATNPADLFTKEDNDVKHFETLRDQMVTSREAFATPSSTIQTNKIQTIDLNPDILWGVLERGLADQDSEELTTLTNSKSMTRSEISNESSNYKDTISKYKDPNHLRSKIEVACE